MKRMPRLALAVMLVVSAVPLPVQASPSPSAALTPSTTGYDVNVTESGFAPATVHCSVGDLVNWINTTMQEISN